jgi:hypothetical protein
MATIPTQALHDSAKDSVDARLVPLRALCELVATGGRMTGAGSITVNLDRASGAGIELLRAAEAIAAEFGVRQRIHLDSGRGTIHVWRDEQGR